jgi:2-methylaconitate cis-trans-isomerase PrpF
MNIKISNVYVCFTDKVKTVTRAYRAKLPTDNYQDNVSYRPDNCTITVFNVTVPVFTGDIVTVSYKGNAIQRWFNSSVDYLVKSFKSDLLLLEEIEVQLAVQVNAANGSARAIWSKVTLATPKKNLLAEAVGYDVDAVRVNKNTRK